MTRDEAIAEAHRRWGVDAFARTVPDPDPWQEEPIIFYEVGHGDTVVGACATIRGFAGAFEDADRLVNGKE